MAGSIIYLLCNSPGGFLQWPLQINQENTHFCPNCCYEQFSMLFFKLFLRFGA